MHRIAFTSAALVLGLAIAASAQAPVAPGFFENFDSEPACATSATAVCTLVGPFTNMTNDTNDWIVDAGGTTSNPTGPQSGDHTTGAGNYLYAETSVPSAAGDVRNLLSPKLDLSLAGNPAIGFWYHMFGTDIGTLHVDLVQQLNSGVDGVTPVPSIFQSGTALFGTALPGDTLVVSGSALGNDGTYTIAAVIDPFTVDLGGPVFASPEAGLTYEHSRTTLDIVPSRTDNLDLWQKWQVVLAPALATPGNTFTAQTIIRYVAGAGFLGDAAIDDFEYVDLLSDDVAVQAIDAPASVCPGTYTISADIANVGANDASGVLVDLIVDGTPIVTENIALLTAGTTQNVVFSVPAPLLTPGTSTIDVVAVAMPDLNPANNSASASVTVTPVIPVVNCYLEDFEAGQGGWTINGSNTTFAFGTPAGAFTGAASGVNAFSTGNGGSYLASENGFVKSPCFDLSAMTNPSVRLKAWWDSEFSWDGANIQYSTDAGATWINIGAFGDPDNWYNDGTINSNPGGSMEGWTGTGGNGSGGYVLASNSIAALAGAPSVEFRINFSSDTSVQLPGGFAFDDFEISETIAVPFAGGFLEDFEAGQGAWTINGSNTTFAFGTPAGAFSGAASGVNAFSTGNGGNYLASENGFVTSPCFDLSELVDPFVRLNIWWTSEFSWDGANLQYSTDGGLNWVTVGALGDPDNWYNDGTIQGLGFTGSQEGWSGSGSNGSGGWVTAVNSIPALAGVSAVQFRINFGSDGSVQLAGGFAFDDFEIFNPDVPFIGSGEDLTLELDVNGALATSPIDPFAAVALGDIVSIRTASPGATYDFAPYALVADVFATGGAFPTPINAAFPEVHISANVLLVFDGNNIGPTVGLTYAVLPGGSTATFLADSPVLAGNSILLQSLVLDGAAANGFFAITNGQVLEFM